MRQFIRDLMILTKFRINVVAVFTGYAALAVYHSLHPEEPWFAVWEILACLAALMLTGGAANTLNQVIEKDKDATMQRTKEKRPLPSGRLSPAFAWSFAFGQEALAVAILVGLFDSWLAAGLSLFTIFYYVVVYTWYLKPRHHLNIVLGGVPGAMGPVIAWAAVAGSIAWEPMALFAIIFLWTPPHFWALAIKLKEDYAAAGIPMLPVVKGIDETTKQIFIYTVIMVLGTLIVPVLLPAAFGASPLFFLASLIGGTIFLVWSWRLWKRRPISNPMPLFRYSILYIGILFAAVILDAVLIRGGQA